MNIDLRKSRPEEVSQAVPLIYSSGPDAFEYVFQTEKNGAQDFLSHAFVRKGGEFSYQNHHSLYLDDQMVGIGSVFGSRVAKGFAASDGKNILRFYGLRSGSVILRGLKVERIIQPPKSNEVALAHLAVDPSHRSRGLGRALIQALMEIVTEEDAQFVLDVSEENPRAKSLYDRLGFVVTDRRTSTLENQFSYVPHHLRMILPRES